MQRQIFLHNSKTDSFVDMTSKIKKIELVKGMYKVTFKENEIPLTYKPKNVRIYGDDSLCIDPSKEVPTFMPDPHNDLSDNILKYLVEYCYRQAAKQAVNGAAAKSEEELEDEESEITPFGILANQLADIEINSESVLYRYLNKVSKHKHHQNQPLLLPFGCNASQMLSVSNALKNPISIIEGPPGTGKTQTILNLIANIIAQRKTIAVVSNNNSAVQNVANKLSQYGFEWLTAALGSRTKRAEYFMNGQLLPNVSKSWELSSEEEKTMTERVQKNADLAMQFFISQNDLQQMKTRLDDTKHELDIFKCQYSDDLKQIQSLADQFLSSVATSEELVWIKNYLSKQFSPMRWYQWMRRFRLWRRGLQHPDLLTLNQEKAVFAINLSIYQRTIQESERVIKECQDWLDSHNMETVVKELTDDSMALFKHKMFKRFSKYEANTFDILTYRQKWDAFRIQHPIILSSTFSLRSSSGQGELFDYLIIDESSQVNIPSAAVCFSLARNVVIVGDSNQLTHIVDKEGLNMGKGLNKAYDANEMSILSSCKKLFGDKIPVQLLREHYRCQPGIIDFCNHRFYDNEMVIMSKDNGDFPYAINWVEANRVETYQGSLFNERQALETIDCVKQLVQSGIKPCEIGIISPYRAHAEYILRKLDSTYRGVEADTVHKFQGREKDVIIYNCVKNEVNSFNDNPNLINVAVSRAKKKFIIIAPECILEKDTSNIASLCKYIEYRDPDCKFISRSKYASIFDVLYRFDESYENSQSGKNIGESSAEVIFRKLLDQVLKGTQKGPSWDFKQEYYLLDLMKGSSSIYSDEEMKYMLHGARLDFLIYDIYSHMPVVAIEVDGTQHYGEKQHYHDTLKDNILTKMDIAHYRFRTDSASGQEEQRLRKILNEAYFKNLHSIGR